MVGIIVSKQRLEKKTGLKNEALLEALAGIKCSFEGLTGDEMKIEVTPDRPDLLSLEGIARYLNGVRGKTVGIPELKIAAAAGNEEVSIDAKVKKIRPIVVAALVECSIDDYEFNALIQLQEKLTLTHGRRRKKVAIGVHDAASIHFPITYSTGKPSEKFVPLKEAKEMSLKQVLEETEKGREYAFILHGLSEYPVIKDASGKIISFPPILNSAVTTVSTKTKKMLVELTGTDFEACNAALLIMLQDFADKGWKIKSIKGGGLQTKPVELSLSAADASKQLGIELNQKQVIDLLQKARMDAKPKGKNEVTALIPRYRSDFLHWIDLVEEIAIAFGLNKMQPVAPRIFTKGGLSEETFLEEKTQDAMVGFGFTELSTHVLTSPEKNEKAFAEKQVVKIKNPVSSDYNALRSTILPSLMQVLAKNTNATYPQKIFEVGEVVVHQPNREQRAVTHTNLCAIDCSREANLSGCASILAELFKDKKIEFKPFASKQFISGRGALVVVNGEEIGVMGELAPALLANYGVLMPASSFEITLYKDRK